MKKILLYGLSLLAVFHWQLGQGQIRPNVKINKKIALPQTEPHMCATRDIIFDQPALYNAVVILPDVTWPNGSELTVSFVDTPSETVKSKIMQYAQVWEDHANIDFVFTDDSDTDIRIGLDKDNGSWSKIGTQAKDVASNKKTMNFSWFDDDTKESTFRRTTLHEFGHALGLKHEHQNPDAGICWDWEAAIDFYEDKNDWTEERTRGNLEALSTTSIGNSTAYDSESIMHYTIDQSVTSCDFEIKSNSVLSNMDKMAIENIYPFRKKRHTVGPNIFNYDWTNGWDNVESFEAGNRSYLFLLKSSTGDVHIHKMNYDGSVGTRVFDKKWTSGWTVARLHKINNQPYLFLLKKGTGDVHIHKINSNGTVGSRVFDKKWSTGWSNAQFFTRSNQSYLFLIKASTGDVHIHKMNSNGTVGARIFDKKWSSGWTTAELFTTNNQQFLFLLKASTGDVHIHKMNSNGTVGTRVFDKKWTSGWTTAEFYESNGQAYLFLLKKSNGDVHQNWVTASGTVGDIIYDNNAKWTDGWTAAEFLPVGNQTYMFLLKTKDGTGHTHLIY